MYQLEKIRKTRGRASGSTEPKTEDKALRTIGNRVVAKVTRGFESLALRQGAQMAIQSRLCSFYLQFVNKIATSAQQSCVKFLITIV